MFGLMQVASLALLSGARKAFRSASRHSARCSSVFATPGLVTTARVASRAATLALVALALLTLTPRRAEAGRPEWAAARGQGLAKKGDCVAATPLLEEAELSRHKPSVAYALAGCYVALGELMRASELYHAIADEEPARGWTWSDRRAAVDAKKRAVEVDARIPTITLSIAESYEDLDVLINGKSWVDPLEPKQVAPDTAVEIEAQAKGTRVFTAKLVLAEGERHILELRLVRKARPPAPPRKGPEAPSTWLGARFRGFLIPKFVLNAAYDGGATVFAPGGGITLQTRVSDPVLIFSVAYASYRAPEMPIKPRTAPDTDYEIADSDLQALFATIDILWTRQLDSAGHWNACIGWGGGGGWMFLGGLYRTQAYPTKTSGNDPYLYAKCKGPNNPAGSFRYCNQLDADATHYPGYSEPSWLDGGRLPTVFPFLAAPELGLSWSPSRSVAIDLEAAASVSGIMLGLGFRYGL